MSSKLTREWLQHQISEIEVAGISDSNTLAAFKLALAAMDGKPTAWKLEGGGAPGHVTLDERVAHADPLRDVTPLYVHTRQPVVSEYPETLPCPVIFELGFRFGKGVNTRLMLRMLQRRAEHYAELDAMGPEARAEHDAAIVELREKLGFGTPAKTAIKVKLPGLPQLGSDAEWYLGFAAGAGSMREACAAAIMAAGVEVEMK